MSEHLGNHTKNTKVVEANGYTYICLW